MLQLNLSAFIFVSFIKTSQILYEQAKAIIFLFSPCIHVLHITFALSMEDMLILVI